MNEGCYRCKNYVVNVESKGLKEICSKSCYFFKKVKEDKTECNKFDYIKK